MAKISFEALNSANVKTNNAVDTERSYDITANVNINNGKDLGNVENGNVTKDGVTVCNFSKYGSSSLNVNFMNIVDATEMCNILTAINEFIEAVKTAVSEGDAVILG